MENTAARPWTKNYQPGVPADIEPPAESLSAMFERSVAEAGDSPATEFFGRRTSYRELGEQVQRAAEGLRALGVRAGDRVALTCPTARSTSSRSTRCCAWARSSWNTTRSTPPANCATNSRTTKPAS